MGIASNVYYGKNLIHFFCETIIEIVYFSSVIWRNYWVFFNKSQRVRYFSVSVLFHSSLICWRLKRFCRLRLFLINGGGTLERSTRSMRRPTPHQVVKRFFIFLALFNLLAWTITDSQWHESLERKMYGNAQMWSRQCNPVINWAQFFLTANFSYEAQRKLDITNLYF